MLSKLLPCNDEVEKIINEILIDRHFTPVTIAVIKDFVKNMTNIVCNKKELLLDILDYFNSCEKYGFLEKTEFIKDNELFKYYFKSGELLAVLYLLCCKDTEELLSLGNTIPIVDNNFSASNIAHNMLENSVYGIDFLPLNEIDLASSDIGSIKSGFEYIYNIIVSNKIGLISFLKDTFASNIEYLGNILNKLNMLNKEDLKVQLYLIEVRFLKNELCRRQITLSEDESSSRLDRKRFIKLADDLGDYLIRKSIIGYKDGKVSRTWINSIVYDFGEKLELSGRTYDLYDGNSGIALFFLYLGELTQKKYFINTALEIMQESIEGMDNICEYSKIIFHELFVLSKIYCITRSQTIEQAINKGILYIYKIIEEGSTDSISAAHASMMLSIYDVIECTDTKKIIINSVKLLYKNIKFEHKYEGVLFFLIKLMSIKKDSEIESAIEKLLDSERKISSNKNYFEILFSRIKLKELEYNDNLINEEINEALKCIVKNGFENNNFYYNQNIFNIEILEYAATVLENESLKNRCINTYNNIVNQIIEPAIYEEISYGNKSISLMNGMAGYGYSLIQNCSDKKAHSSLSFEWMMYIDHERKLSYDKNSS